MSSSPRPVSEFTRRHAATIALLAFGYTGYYFCRSDLSVVMPLLIQELAKHGMTAHEAEVRLGGMVSLSVLAYAAGKFVSGAMADVFGGRRNFLGGMGGAIVFTILFAVSGSLPMFTLAWLGNRLLQSGGWTGLVKVTSRWFSYSKYGTVMGFLALSYLFGDAASRYAMSLLLDAGLGWRGVFFSGAGFLGLLMLANWIFLRESPEECGLLSPVANPLNVYAGGGDKVSESRMPLSSILLPLVRSFPFWLVCLLSLGTTLLRETFNFWTPTYFVQYVGLTNAQAASRSALFPLFGGLSVVVSGVLSDRLGLNGRNRVLFGGLALAAFCLLALSMTPSSANPWIAVGLVAMTGFLMLGPYAYLSGAISLDFGGKRGSASAAGIIDGVGYIAGYLSGDAVARIATGFGWRSAFLSLAGVAFFTAIVALVLVIHQHRREPIETRVETG